MTSSSTLHTAVSSLRLTRRPALLSHCLHQLAAGVKPCLLWDLGGSNTPSSLLSLQAVLGPQRLVVLSLAGDLLLAYRSTLQSHLSRLLDQPPVLVDCSAGLAGPVVAEAGVTASLVTWLASIHRQLISSHRDTVEIEIQQVTFSSGLFTPAYWQDWNLATVFGAVLGYPVVYYTFPEAGEDNCLANLPLAVYRLGDFSPAPTSFSVPLVLEPQLGEWLEAWRGRALAAGLAFTRDVVCLPVVAL